MFACLKSSFLSIKSCLTIRAVNLFFSTVFSLGCAILLSSIPVHASKESSNHSYAPQDSSSLAPAKEHHYNALETTPNKVLLLVNSSKEANSRQLANQAQAISKPQSASQAQASSQAQAASPVKADTQDKMGSQEQADSKGKISAAELEGGKGLIGATGQIGSSLKDSSSLQGKGRDGQSAHVANLTSKDLQELNQALIKSSNKDSNVVVFPLESSQDVCPHCLESDLDFETQKQLDLVTAYIMRNLFAFSCHMENQGCDQLVKAEHKVQSIENAARSFESQGFILKDKDYEILSELKGVEGSVQERINSIYIGPLDIAGYDKFTNMRLVPFSFGQQYIGKISAKEYEMAWKRYLDKVNTDRPPNGMQNCYLSAAGSNLSIFGNSCLPFEGFKRVEAHANNDGTLVAVSIYAKLQGVLTVETFSKFLDSRYLAISPTKHNLKELAMLTEDLSTLMCVMSKGEYINDVYWYNYDSDKYIKASFSTYKDYNYISLIFADYGYFINTEKSATLRRLAVIRQEIQRLGALSDADEDTIQSVCKIKKGDIEKAINQKVQQELSNQIRTGHDIYGNK